MAYGNIYVTCCFFFLNKWIHLVSSQVNITVGPAFLRVPHLRIQPTSKYYQKKSSKFQKAKFEFPCTGKFLYSVYIVLGFTQNLDFI